LDAAQGSTALDDEDFLFLNFNCEDYDFLPYGYISQYILGFLLDVSIIQIV